MAKAEKKNVTTNYDPPLNQLQRGEVANIARDVANEVFASKVAAALADPDVHGKSALGYLLGKVRRR